MANPQFTHEEGEPPVLKDMLKITLMVRKHCTQIQSIDSTFDILENIVECDFNTQFPELFRGLGPMAT